MTMPTGRFAPLVRDEHYVRRYLLRDEVLVVAVRRSLVSLAEPILTAIGCLFGVLYITFTAVPGNESIVTALWWLWFVSLGRLAIRVVEWRREYFIATDRRLLLIYGFITRKVGMLPLSKVTDMTYQRSIPGRLLGYGTFVLESAGQDQALSTIDFVPRPDPTYRAIMKEIFVRSGDVEQIEPVTDDDDLLEEHSSGQRGGFSPDRPPQQTRAVGGIIAAMAAARAERRGGGSGGSGGEQLDQGPISQRRTGAVGVPPRSSGSLYRAGYDEGENPTSSGWPDDRDWPAGPRRS